MTQSDLSENALRQGLNTRFVGQPIHYYPVLASTQDAAKEAAEDGVPEGTVFNTDEQTAGRGRLGRTWQAPHGSSLLLSLVLRPSPTVYPKLVMVGSLAVAEAIEETTDLRAQFKWPNDVLIHDKKVAGVMVEGEFQGTRPLFAVLGIGINVNLDAAVFTEMLYPATSLAAEAGAPVSRLSLAQSLLGNLERELLQASSRPRRVHQRWRSRLATLGKQIRVRMGDQVLEGLAEDVDADGSLLLSRRDGSLTTIVAGDVTLQV